MFPGSFIYFGVLHGMAVMLVLVRLTAGWGAWLWPLGLLAIAMKFIAAYEMNTGTISLLFNENWLNWLGMINRLPVTEDYVPLIPWLGVMWWGMAATQWLLRRTEGKPLPALRARWMQLAQLGRWSLSYYMVHQPVLLAGLWLWAWITR
jgi:uncharacterized membrane protein